MTDKPTQADRGLANKIAMQVRLGTLEADWLLAKIADYRLTTEAAKDAEIAELVALLREFQDFVQGLSSRFAHPLGSLQQINEILAKHGGGNE